MHITVGPRDLNSLFNDVKVRIPNFQRNYSWTKSQVSQFLADVYAAAESETSHFWGPVVVLRRPETPRELEVIDGQQRITTAIIMLAILRDLALKLNQPMVNVGTPGQWSVTSAVRNFLFQPPKYAQPRFQGSYLIAPILAERIIADPQSPGGADGNPVIRQPINPKGGGLSPSERKYSKELRSAYRQMTESLERAIESQPSDNAKTQFVADTFTSLTSRFEIYTLELVSEDDAYVLFESLNDRGLRLNPADILKTLTLHNISQSPGLISVEKALEIWDESSEALGELDFAKFLRHHLLTRTTRKVQSRRIVSEFRELIGRLDPDGAYKNLLDIEKSAVHYSQLLGTAAHPDQKLRESFARINRYSETHRVFLLAVLKAVNGVSNQQKLARAVEYLSFRWIAVGGNAQELESLYQKFAHVVSANPSDEVINAVVKDCISAAPADDKFMSALFDSRSPELQKYLLLRIGESGGGAISGTADLEHLAPRTPAANAEHWFASVANDQQPDAFGKFYDNYVDSWGNLTLLESKLNQSIKNAPWSVKISGAGAYKGISASSYGLNAHIKTLPAWTAAHIRHREEWMKQCAQALVSAAWVKKGAVPVSDWAFR
jgi:hypothetical protein